MEHCSLATYPAFLLITFFLPFYSGNVSSYGNLFTLQLIYLFTTYKFTIYNLQLTIYNLQLQFITYNLQFTITYYNLQLTIYNLQLTIYNLQLIYLFTVQLIYLIPYINWSSQ